MSNKWTFFIKTSSVALVIINYQAENKELKKSDSEKTAEIQKLRMELNAHKALYENMKQCLTSFEESSKEVLVKKRQS